MNNMNNMTKKLLLATLISSVLITGCATSKTKLTNTNVIILSIKNPHGASGYSNGQAAGLGAQVGGGLGGVAVAAVASLTSIFVNEATTKTDGVAEIIVQKIENGDKFSGRYKITPFIDSLHEGDIAKSTLDENGDLTLVKAE